MFKTSYSKIKLGRRCLKAYKYKYVDKVRRKIKPKPLMIGGLIHECIEAWFKGKNYKRVLSSWKKKELDKMFEEERVLYDDIVPLIEHLMLGYEKHWEDSGLNMLWTEKPFEVEIAPDILLVGKIDGKASEGKNRKWIVEHKSVNKMPGEEVRIFDTQVILYSRIEEMLEGKKATGVIWDYIAKKTPSIPQLLKSGGLSRNSRILTTPEVYLREIERHGLDPLGYVDILKDLELKRSQFFRHVKVPVSKSACDTVMREAVIASTRLQELEERHYSGEDVFERNITRDCSWCEWKNLCHSELMGSDTDFILKKEYIQDGKEKASSKKKVRRKHSKLRRSRKRNV